jgi:hypothetical protein
MDEPNKPPNTILVTYEEFVAITQRLKGEILKGKGTPVNR